MTSGASASREVLLTRFRRQFDLDSLAPDRIDLALTHSSWANASGSREDNERLEFLGDAVLSSAASHYLYEKYTDADEGALSKLRARIVSRTMLGKRAADMEMAPLLLLGKGVHLSAAGLRRSLLGGALEALIGVIFLDRGYAAAAEFVVRHVVEPVLGEIDGDELTADFKSELQEWTQARSGATPVYRLVEEQGPAHRRVFTAEVEVDGRPLAQGEGSRIKRAENDAARRALEILRAEENP